MHRNWAGSALVLLLLVHEGTAGGLWEGSSRAAALHKANLLCSISQEFGGSEKGVARRKPVHKVEGPPFQSPPPPPRTSLCTALSADLACACRPWL